VPMCNIILYRSRTKFFEVVSLGSSGTDSSEVPSMLNPDIVHAQGAGLYSHAALKSGLLSGAMHGIVSGLSFSSCGFKPT